MHLRKALTIKYASVQLNISCSCQLPDWILLCSVLQMDTNRKDSSYSRTSQCRQQNFLQCSKAHLCEVKEPCLHCFTCRPKWMTPDNMQHQCEFHTLLTCGMVHFLGRQCNHLDPGLRGSCTCHIVWMSASASRLTPASSLCKEVSCHCMNSCRHAVLQHSM